MTATEPRTCARFGASRYAGVIRPVVDRVFPFEKTSEALAYVETGRAKGKVVITVAD